MKKRMTALIMAIILLVALLPMAALAEMAAPNDGYLKWTSNVGTDTDLWNGATATDLVGLKFDPVENVLTVTGENEGHLYAYKMGELTIVMEDGAAIVYISSGGSGQFGAIEASGCRRLTIKVEGSAEIKRTFDFNNTDGAPLALAVGGANLTIEGTGNGGRLTITNEAKNLGDGRTTQHGIYIVNGDLIITGGVYVTSTAKVANGETKAPEVSNGIYVLDGDINVENGRLRAYPKIPQAMATAFFVRSPRIQAWVAI